MAYTPTVWKNGEFPPIDAEHLNKIEQGIANSAPGGYGIGETPKYIADANDAVKNGRYAIDGSTLNLPGSNGDLWAYAYLDVYTGNRPDVYIKQTITSPYQYWHQCEVTRCFYSPRGGWQPWEWVNPPMILGTEYRTTERYLGRPVYTQIVQFDNLSTNQAFAPGGEIFRAIGEYQYPDSSGKYIPNMPTKPPGGTMTADSPYMEFGDTYNRTLRVQLKSDSKCLGKSARVQMWYMK